MPRKPKRRFLELEVDEVSVVDSPANEIQFLVTKNLEEEEEMPGKAADDAKVVERVAVENPGSAADESVAKAMEHVHGIIKDITGYVSKVSAKKSASAEEAEEKDDDEESEKDDDKKAEASADEKDGEEGKDDTDKKEVEKGGGRSVRGLLKTLGLSGETLKKAEAKLKALGVSPDTRIGGAVATKKSEEKADESDLDEDDPMLTALAESISKAKRLTPARIKKLQEAAEIINKLVIESIAQGTSPKMDKLPLSPRFESQMKPKGQLDRAVFKADEDTDPYVALLEVVKEGFDGVKKSIENVIERVSKNESEVEAIKSARPASNSLNEHGTTEKTQKASPSFWRGVV